MTTDNFYTPVYDALVVQVGNLAAQVYGAVERFCRARGRSCYASRETIAKKLGLSAKSVGRALKLLRERGLIVDTTPEVLGRPHVYITRDMVATLPSATWDSQSHYSGTHSPRSSGDSPSTEGATWDSQSHPRDSQSLDLGLTVPGGGTHSPSRIHIEDNLENSQETGACATKNVAQAGEASGFFEEPEASPLPTLPLKEERRNMEIAPVPVDNTPYYQARRALRVLKGGAPLSDSEKLGIRQALERYGPQAVFEALAQAGGRKVRGWEDVAALLDKGG